MLSVLDLAQENTHLRKASRNEYAGPCPGCGGDDRFRVKVNDEGRWSFMCRGCYDSQEYLADKDRKRGWGDAYEYLRHYRRMKHDEIKALLDGQEGKPGAQRVRTGKSGYGYKSEDWQTVVAKSVKEYEALLWSDEGAAAREYVRGRGLSDATMKKAHLGYSAQGGIPRLLIPVFNEMRYVAVYRRDLRPDCPHRKRWMDAPGGTKDELYLADCLNVKRPTVLVEAAIDALSIVQECSGMVNVVATGSTDGARTIKALARLALMPIVFVAFDADKPGDSAAEWWLKCLPNARRLRPLLHDVNDMLTDGWDIRAWVEQAIQEQKGQEGREDEKLPPLDCQDCHATDEEREYFYTDMGYCYCEGCRDPQTSLPWPAPLVSESNDVVSTLSREEIVERFTAGLPGWKVELAHETFEELMARARDEAENGYKKQYHRLTEEQVWARIKRRANLPPPPPVDPKLTAHLRPPFVVFSPPDTT